MVIDDKTKKILKILGLVLVLLLLTGCATNLKDGKLIAERAITNSTKWNLGVGWFDFLFVIPIAKAILFFEGYFGNVVFGIIFVTIIINLITLPIMIKSTISSQKMQLLQPEMEKIQRKYKGRKDQASKMRQQSEISALYKKNNVSMFGSFTMLLTMPVMFAMWQSVQRLDILYKSSFIGIKLGDQLMTHLFKFDVIYIVLLLIVGVTQFFAMEITNMMNRRNPKFKPSAQMQSMKKMNNFFTVLILYFAATMPAAMSFYWITSNLISIARTVYIQFFHIEKTKKEVDTVNTNFLNKK